MSAPTLEDPGLRILDDAYALANDGQLAAAHARIKDIPASSAALKDPRVHEIEARWADERFVELDRCEPSDEECRKKLVYELASASTLDSERRERALAKLREIVPDAPDPLEVPSSVPVAVGGTPPVYFPPEPTTTVFVPNPTSTKPTIAPSSLVSADPQAAAKSTYDRLYPQLSSNRLSIPDLSQLSKACGTLQIPSCQSQCAKQIAERKKNQK